MYCSIVSIALELGQGKMTGKISKLFLVVPQEMKRFVTECMVVVGTAGKHGEILAATNYSLTHWWQLIGGDTIAMD